MRCEVHGNLANACGLCSRVKVADLRRSARLTRKAYEIRIRRHQESEKQANNLARVVDQLHGRILDYANAAASKDRLIADADEQLTQQEDFISSLVRLNEDKDKMVKARSHRITYLLDLLEEFGVTEP